MTRWIAGVGVAGLALLAVAGLRAQQAGGLQPQQEVGNAPGMPTIARTYVLNRGPAEAVPVTLSAGGDVLPVELVGQPTVGLSPGAPLPVRGVRQTWEYRQLSVGDADETIAALNEAGDEGWEAVGAIALAGNETAILLKRPQ